MRTGPKSVLTLSRMASPAGVGYNVFNYSKSATARFGCKQRKAVNDIAVEAAEAALASVEAALASATEVHRRAKERRQVSKDEPRIKEENAARAKSKAIVARGALKGAAATCDLDLDDDANNKGALGLRGAAFERFMPKICMHPCIGILNVHTNVQLYRTQCCANL